MKKHRGRQASRQSKPLLFIRLEKVSNLFQAICLESETSRKSINQIVIDRLLLSYSEDNNDTQTTTE